jgi:HSP20 family molecular chaperone IbpA
MEVNYCPNCGKKREKGEVYCFNCGTDLSRFEPPKGGLEAQLQQLMNRFIQDNPDFIRDMMEKIQRGGFPGAGMFFSVEMHGDKPIVKSGDLKDMEKIMKDIPLPPFVRDLMERSRMEGRPQDDAGMEFQMAETSERKIPEGTVVEARMPGVESMDAVEVNLRRGNLEILGRSAKTVYFAEVPVERGMVIKDTRVIQGVLKVVLGPA